MSYVFSCPLNALRRTLKIVTGAQPRPIMAALCIQHWELWDRAGFCSLLKAHGSRLFAPGSLKNFISARCRSLGGFEFRSSDFFAVLGSRFTVLFCNWHPAPSTQQKVLPARDVNRVGVFLLVAQGSWLMADGRPFLPRRS
jgi:hypothetical protein